MKIGFNVKKIYENVMIYIENMTNSLGNTLLQYGENINKNTNNITSLNNRVSTLENKSSEWVEITSSNGQEAEITQAFSEIKMQARGFGTLYSVTCDYDSTIFHNSSSDAPTYIIAGNPIENNYGCKFKYMIVDNKQYVCVDKCFSGGSQEGIVFRAWIKPVQSGTQ